jgi:hypothetical protein
VGQQGQVERGSSQQHVGPISISRCVVVSCLYSFSPCSRRALIDNEESRWLRPAIPRELEEEEGGESYGKDHTRVFTAPFVSLSRECQQPPGPPSSSVSSAEKTRSIILNSVQERMHTPLSALPPAPHPPYSFAHLHQMGGKK